MPVTAKFELKSVAPIPNLPLKYEFPEIVKLQVIFVVVPIPTLPIKILDWDDAVWFKLPFIIILLPIDTSPFITFKE